MEFNSSFELVQSLRTVSWLAEIRIKSLPDEGLDSLKYLDQRYRETLKELNCCINRLVDEVEEKENCDFDRLLIKRLQVWAADSRPEDDELKDRLEKYEKDEDF